MSFNAIIALKSTPAGTQIRLEWLPGSGTRLSVGTEVRGKDIPGEDFYRALLRIWIGEKPVDPDLKNALLGKARKSRHLPQTGGGRRIHSCLHPPLIETPSAGKKPFSAILPAPFGALGIVADSEYLHEIVFLPSSVAALQPSGIPAEKALQQLARYLADPDYRFDLPLAEQGSHFRRRTWAAIGEIPRGETSVGPGRGSASGSAVAYCIGITNVDPVAYDLLFERFLNPDRVSLPDIDIDFDDEGLDKVLKYVIEKYGHDQVAQIITYGTMAAKSSIRDCARVME